MKNTLVFRITLLAIVAAGLILSSCKKDKDDNNNNTDPNYRAAIDNSTAEGVFNRSYNQISNASYQSTTKGAKDTIIGCPTLYISASGYPITVTLDFGSSCTDSAGITRSGKIISTITCAYITTGCVVTSTFDNYHEIIGGIDYQATGTQVITNLGPNTDGHPIYSVDVTGSVISQYGTITYTSQRENEFYEGYNSWFNPFDDKYKITGTASGTDINGDPFAITITDALEFDFMCDLTHWWIIKKGKFDLSYPGTTYPNITVDYGTGTCDYTIYVTVNGQTYTISYV